MNDSPTSVNTAGCNPSEAILHNLQCEPDLVHGLGIVLMVHRCHRLGDIGASDIGRLDSLVAVAQLEPKQMFEKISQSRRRPLLGPSPG